MNSGRLFGSAGHGALLYSPAIPTDKPLMSTPKGSYYIRVRKTGWYVWHQEWQEGKRTQEKVADIACRTLGFQPEWSVDQAKAHAAQLNREQSDIRDKIRKAGKRLTSLRSTDKTLFPPERVEEFQQVLENENFGSSKHLSKQRSQFLFVQRMCNELRIQPIEYRENQRLIYKHFIKMKVSANYASVLISMLNRWGKFVSRKSGTFFEPVDTPKGRERSAIAEAQLTKRGKDTDLGVRTESQPLTPEILERSRNKLSHENFNWLKLAVWFGLRPEEVDSLADSKRTKIEFLLKKNVHVLKVYQSKLQSIAADKRWKTIPVVFEEQKVCLEIIKRGNFKRPIYKTMRKHIGGGVSLYGGRKAFTDLMLERGQKLEDISLWLGHKDISTTWQHYKNKDIVSFTEIEEKKKQSQ